MHRPRDTDGGEHEQEVVPRLRDPFHAARLQCIHGLPEKPGDGEPDHLRDGEEDDEQHDVAAAALGMPPERRIEIPYIAGREGVAHRLRHSKWIFPPDRPKSAPTTVVFCRSLDRWRDEALITPAARTSPTALEPAHETDPGARCRPVLPLRRFRRPAGSRPRTPRRP